MVQRNDVVVLVDAAQPRKWVVKQVFDNSEVQLSSGRKLRYARSAQCVVVGQVRGAKPAPAAAAR